jgi:heme/copper-type cytochrome/quinol oxidase subunit 3
MTGTGSRDQAIAQRDHAIAALRTDGAALDVSALPSFGFGHRSIMWWGTMGLIAIESTVFALAVATYFYIRSQAAVWPLAELPPQLLWGSVNTALFLLSLWPAHKAKHASEKLDLPGTRRWVSASSAMALAILVVRVFEYRSLNCSWDGSAYGSAVWLLLSLHTVHLITDAYDTLVLNVLAFTGPLEGKRFVDMSENAMYWYFVVWSWLPIYAVLYWAPRGG